MPSDLLRLFIVLMASISAMLFARFLARAIARAQSAEAPNSSGAGPTALAPAAGSPTPQDFELVQSPPPMTPLAVVPERRARHLNLADARTAIVLATILGPCRAHSPAGDHQA